jgi:N-acetyl-1-D-myo-inositol-2-amino-2-deoxy-alpha-D-glucopyranoside deacetylase
MAGFEKVMLKDQSQPVLLAVLAHPDDETFGTGGTLALYSRCGVQVYLVCATRGEVGEMDPKLLEGFDSVGEKREYELRCAANTLGLARVFFLGYRDSGMPGSPDNTHPQALTAAPLDQVAAKVAHFIRKLHPQVVITFDPIGGYRHPDHIAIQRATVKAFDAAGQAGVYPDPEGLPPYTPRKLYYNTFSRTFLRVSIAVLRLVGRDPRRFGVNGDIDLASIAEVSFPINARIKYKPVAAIRDEAAACHASQGGGQMGSGLQGWITRRFRGDDTYMRACPEPKKGEKLERDLFAGV